MRSLLNIRSVVSRFCSFLWKSVFGSSRQLALGTWKSTCQETDWGRRCGMVTPPGCRHTADQAPLCVSCQKKTSLKTPSQPRKPVPTAPFRNKMASRYSYFPVSHYQTDHQIFCFPFSVWMWTHRLHRCVCSVHKCVCTFVFQARRELWSRQSLTATDPFKLLSNHLCVVYLADTVKLWADSFFSPLRGLTECWNNVRNAFHNVGKIPPLCQALQLVLSQCWLSSQRGHLVTVIHTVIFHREMNIH